jgi:hypothetical protein
MVRDIIFPAVPITKTRRYRSMNEEENKEINPSRDFKNGIESSLGFTYNA